MLQSVAYLWWEGFRVQPPPGLKFQGFNASKCFSILADETADVSGVDQVSLCVRYVEINHLELRQEFLEFVPTFNVTGKGLAKLIIDNLQKYGILI